MKRLQKAAALKALEKLRTVAKKQITAAARKIAVKKQMTAKGKEKPQPR